MLRREQDSRQTRPPKGGHYRSVSPPKGGHYRRQWRPAVSVVSAFRRTLSSLSSVSCPSSRPVSRHRRVRSNIRAPLAFGPDSNADPRPPCDLVRGWQPSIFDIQPRSAEIGLVLGQRDPHRHREIPWSATEFMQRELGFLPRAAALHAPRATPPHQVNPLE